MIKSQGIVLLQILFSSYFHSIVTPTVQSDQQSIPWAAGVLPPDDGKRFVRCKHFFLTTGHFMLSFLVHPVLVGCA